MKDSYEEKKMFQSRSIIRLGCMGIGLILIVLIIIGNAAISADLNEKRDEANACLSRMYDQIEKAPAILTTMVSANECDPSIEESIDDLRSEIENLAGNESPEFSMITGAWEDVETVFNEINSTCQLEPDIASMTDYEGIRNRFSVERGNYREKAQVYNSAVNEFPGSLLKSRFDELEVY